MNTMQNASWIKPCPACGNGVSKNAQACPTCGHDMRPATQNNPKLLKNCPACGHIVSKRASRCPECGHMVKPISERVATYILIVFIIYIIILNLAK